MNNMFSTDEGFYFITSRFLIIRFFNYVNCVIDYSIRG